MPIHACQPAAASRRPLPAGRRCAGLLLVLGLPLLIAGCEILPPSGGAAPQPVALPRPAAPPKPAVPLPAAKPPVPASAGGLAVDEQGRPLVIGLNREALIRQFGAPAAEREASPARVLEFRREDCRLAAYLYFDTVRNDFYALQYEINGSVEHNAAADRCLTRIARHARH